MEVKRCPDCHYQGNDFIDTTLPDGESSGIKCPKCGYFAPLEDFDIIEDSEGTQVTDIEKKEDYPNIKQKSSLIEPTFKIGKHITNLNESRYDYKLPEDLKVEARKLYDELNKHNDYPCSNWADRLGFSTLDTVNCDNSPEQRQKEYEDIKRYYEEYISNPNGFNNALDILKKNHVSLWPHSIPQLSSDGSWIFTGIKGISQGQESYTVKVTKDGQLIEES